MGGVRGPGATSISAASCARSLAGATPVHRSWLGCWRASHLESPHGAQACIGHAAECGAGNGLFLLVGGSLSSAALLVRERRVMLLNSPYRDAHGETDPGLQRGMPLTLHELEYAKLMRQWVSLSFEEAVRPDDHDMW